MLMTEKNLRTAIRRIIIESCGCSANKDAGIGDVLDSIADAIVDEPSGRMLDYGSSKSDSGEGKMTKAKLFRLSQMSQRLHDILEDEDDLPGWVNDKVTTAEDRLKSAHDYILYKVRE